MATWWDEWELRILVLASLGAQYFLLLFAVIRKFHIPPWLRSSFRLAHIASDALAVFALATLFDRQKSRAGCSYTPASRDLELFWAPMLLMHLGGQVIITSYRIEDNERSTRYILTSLSKVTVALYLFYKTWSSDDKNLLAATAVLFILVIIKCFYKALHLKRSSFNTMLEVKVIRDTGIREDGQAEQLFHFIKSAKKAMDCNEPQRTVTTPSPADRLFMDFPYTYSDRLEMVRNFWSLDGGSGFRAIEVALSVMTSILYTKDGAEIFLQHMKNPSLQDSFHLCWELLAFFMIALAYLLQTNSARKRSKGEIEAFRNEDISVTAFLLVFTILLEALHWFTHFFDNFSGRIHQHSLIEFLAQNKRHSMLRSMAGWLQCKDLLDGFYRMEPSNSCEEITELVRFHVEIGWKEYIKDPHSYRMFNDTRGEWTLARNRCLQELGWSTRRPFDESIVLWHLATDLYIHRTGHTSPYDYECARRCKEMSNYMVHLLYDNPEMLMPGSRKRLLATVSEELEVLFEGERIPSDERELTRRVFEKCESAASLSQGTVSLIGDAWELAQSLLSFDENETKIWDLIIGVWLEMLCFSASRCRGYLHAQALGTGVEYLSYVWVLLVFTGMETFSEKLQRRECNSFDSDESFGFGLAPEGGDTVTPHAGTGVEMLPEELQRREGHSFDSDEALHHGLPRETGDVVPPFASQGEITGDVVLEVLE